MKRLITLVPTTIVLALVLSSCSMHLGLSRLLGGGSSTSSGSSGAPTVKETHTPAAPVSSISINNGKFRPKNASVKVGSTLTWTNNDSVPQSVTSDTPGIFDSGLLQPGATFKFTFSTAGTFPYHSTGSSNTFGSVTVTP